MIKAEWADVGAFPEESTAIVGLIIQNKEQLKNLWIPFLETLKKGEEYMIVSEEYAIPRFVEIADSIQLKDILNVKMSRYTG